MEGLLNGDRREQTSLRQARSDFVVAGDQQNPKRRANLANPRFDSRHLRPARHQLHSRNCPSCSAPSALNLDPEIWESSSSSIQWTSAPPKEPDFPATILFRWSNGEISAISSTSTTTSTSTSSQLRRFYAKHIRVRSILLVVALKRGASRRGTGGKQHTS